jgi:type IX secretion system PorP/SprF family membrane protein
MHNKRINYFRMNKRILQFAFLLCLICPIRLRAQQLPHYTQYVLNQYAINPALTGVENYTDIRMSHRRQWTGLEGAPLTSYLTIHMPIGKKDYRTTATSFDMDGENPLGPQYWRDYEASPAHHGIGIQLFNDRIGPFNDFNAYLTYAYHMPIGAKTNLSAGIGAGFGNLSLSTGKLFFGNVNPTDPAVTNGDYLRNLRFNAKAGLYLYSADYFAGISVQEILPQKIDFSGNTLQSQTGKWVPHVFITGGYRIPLSSDMQWIPSALIKLVKPSPVQFDLNSKFQYRDKIWAGLSYRHLYGVAGMAGVRMQRNIHFSYSYDYSVTPLNQVSNGSHEFQLGFLLGNKYGGTCPKNVW